ncbi:unnamed protein product, partial [Meganyctiphanes norvegica]
MKHYRILPIMRILILLVTIDAFSEALGDEEKKMLTRCGAVGNRCRYICAAATKCGAASSKKPNNCPGSSHRAGVRDCRETEFKCGNGNCIPKSWICDGANDCRDNTDEAVGQCTNHCSEMEFQCKSGRCVSKHWRCDGQADCDDQSDEADCPAEETVPPHMYQCTQSKITIPLRWRCDGEVDCTDGTDEEGCDELTTKSPTTISVSNTTSRTTAATSAPGIWNLNPCRDGEFRCGPLSGYCIREAWKCDGDPDCPNGLDEQDCPEEECAETHFKCANKQCVYGHQRCNSVADCWDGSDEKNCSYTPIPSTNATKSCNTSTEFKCSDNKCIPKSSLCNGRNDCTNWEDESETQCGVNECETHNGGCSHICIDSRESYQCECRKGYRLLGKYTCEDVDECTEIPGTCSQKCTNTNGGFHCSCEPGYKRDYNNYTRCKATTGEPKLFFSHKYDIRSLRLNDLEMTSIVNGARSATALDYLYSENIILWADNKEHTIYRTNLSSPDTHEVVVSHESVSADGIAVDWVHRHLYYTDITNYKIRMVSWDGHWSKVVASDDVGHPRAIVVNPMEGALYWTDWGAEAKIERSGLEGSERRAIIRPPNVQWPNGLTIDYSTKRLFWVDGRLNSISSAKLDGSNIEVILYSQQVLRLPYSISVFEDRIYWTDWSKFALFSADKFTGVDIKNITAGHMLESPKVVHVYHPYRQPPGDNVCAFSTCSHMCTRSLIGTALCVCPIEGNLVFLEGSRTTCVSPDTSHLPHPHPQPVIPSITVVAGPSTATVSLIIGVVVAALVCAALVVIFVVIKLRRTTIQRVRFHNPVYRKTVADDDQDGSGGFAINADDMLYHHSTLQYPSIENPMSEDDDVPLAPKDKK